MTIRNLSPFLGTFHSGELNGDWDSLIIPFLQSFSISWMEYSRRFSGTLYDLKLMIFPYSRTISCCVRFVHGSVSVSKENTSWYFVINLCIISFWCSSKWSSFDSLKISCNLFHSLPSCLREFTSLELIVGICLYIILVFIGLGSIQ